MASSPWGKIESQKVIDFQEIMSEEYAKDLQERENRKFMEQVIKQSECHDLAKDFVDVINNNNIDIAFEYQQQKQKQQSSVAHDLVDFDSVKKFDETEEVVAAAMPEDFLQKLKYEVPYNLDDFCNSDQMIAEMLQVQFDREHDDEIKRLEKHNNKDSKVSVSFKNYYRMPLDTDNGDDIENNDDDEDIDNLNEKHWDRFDINEKKFEGIPKKGFTYDEDGIKITKHDENICGVRNACRVMSFPPEFLTGDAAGYDIKLSNSVFNQLKTYSRRSKKSTKAHDRQENVSTTEMGLDKQTRLILFQFINAQLLEQVNGIISTGKEAIVVHGDTVASEITKGISECAIKIFTTTLNVFKQRDRYIKDDYRFKDRFTKQNDRAIINLWAEKEMHNLTKMRKYGINCPEVITIKQHVLVMSFIGENNIAAPKLKDSLLSAAEYIIAYDEIVDMMKRLYQNANLVHADLSEYNVLWYNNQCWLIDVAQSVDREHPSALEFLLRDCHNISKVSK